MSESPEDRPGRPVAPEENVFPALQAACEGFDVYVVTDASGGVSVEAHDMAVRRMVHAGIVPITWMAVLAKLQRDWARADLVAPEDLAALMGHSGGAGVAFAWEMQFLNTPVPNETAPGKGRTDSTGRRERRCRPVLERCRDFPYSARRGSADRNDEDGVAQMLERFVEPLVRRPARHIPSVWTVGDRDDDPAD